MKDCPIYWRIQIKPFCCMCHHITVDVTENKVHQGNSWTTKCVHYFVHTFIVCTNCVLLKRVSFVAFDPYASTCLVSLRSKYTGQVFWLNVFELLGCGQAGLTGKCPSGSQLCAFAFSLAYIFCHLFSVNEYWWVLLQFIALDRMFDPDSRSRMTAAWSCI